MKSGFVKRDPTPPPRLASTKTIEDGVASLELDRFMVEMEGRQGVVGREAGEGWHSEGSL